jgi:hypothetical protein
MTAYDLKEGKQNQWHANDVNYYVHLVMVICTILDYGLAAAGDALYNVQPCGLGHVGSGILAGSLTKVSCFSRLRDMAVYWVLEIRGRC